MAKNVSCKITLNKIMIKKLERAQITALEKTVEYIHTDVIQSQTVPFDDPTFIKYKEYGARGQFSKTGREYKGKVKKKQVGRGGTLQNEKLFVNLSKSKKGQVYLCAEGPYARRLYFHPEYHFDTGENSNAGGKWLEPYKDGNLKSKKVHNAYNNFYKKESGL